MVMPFAAAAVFVLFACLVGFAIGYSVGKRALFDLIKHHAIREDCSYETAYNYELDVFEGRAPRGE